MDRVLIIEDEPSLRSSMARAISKIPGIIAMEANDLSEGLKEIDSHQPFLILSDINLPGRKGIELLGELEKRDITIPIVFMTAYLQTYGSHIPDAQNIEVKEKPISLTKLRELVIFKRNLLKNDHKLPFTIADYLQISCIGNYSLLIRVGLDDRDIGSILVFNGEIWSALDQEGGGKDAFKRLLLMENYQLSCNNYSADPGKRNIEGLWEELVINALIDKDDNDVSTSTQTNEPEITESDSFKRKMEEVNNYLLDKKYPEALEILLKLKESNETEPQVTAKLARLKALGYHHQDNKTTDE